MPPSPGRCGPAGRPAASQARRVALRSVRPGRPASPRRRPGRARSRPRSPRSHDAGRRRALAPRRPQRTGSRARDGLRAECESGHDAPAVGDPAGRDDRQRRATASTTAGTRAIVPIVPCTCPPASQPCATTTSTPRSAQGRRPRRCPRVCRCRALADRTTSRTGPGSPQNVETTFAPSSRQASSLSRIGRSRTRFTPTGRVVRLCLPQPLPHLGDVERRLSEHAEPAGLADGRSQLGGARRADRCLDDGQLDAEQLAQRGTERHVFPSRFRAGRLRHRVQRAE